MGDWFRLLWGLAYWNAVKARFVARGRPGMCRCQAPSDSGRPWETHCEAASSWDRPARFRHVCPALRRGPDGWRCSVASAEIRPHWGRAAAWTGGLALAVHLIVATAAWSFLTARGYGRLAWLDVVLPTRWERIPQSRRDLFLREAMAALERGDLKAMRLGLASASLVSSRDYDTRLAIAQVEAHALVRSSVRPIFEQLITLFPGQRERTWAALRDVLLIQGQFEELARLALQRAVEVPEEQRDVWRRLFLTGLRGSPSPGRLLSAQVGGVDSLPRGWAELARAWGDHRTGASGREAAWLAGVPAGAGEVALTLEWLELISEALPVLSAAEAISAAGPRIGSFHRDRLLFRLGRREGIVSARGAFSRMMGQAGQPLQRALLLAALVEFPDPVCLGRVAASMQAPNVPFSRSELGGIWVALARAGDRAGVEAVERQLLARYGRTVPPEVPRAYSPAAAEIWCHALELDREVVAALSLAGASARRLAWDAEAARSRGALAPGGSAPRSSPGAGRAR